MKTCPNCQTELPIAASFCWNCGVPQPVSKTKNPISLFSIDFDNNPEGQISDLFFKALKHRIEQEHEAKRYGEYMELVYSSGWRDVIQRRSKQLAAEIQPLKPTSQLLFLEVAFEDLLDFFIIHHAKDLNTIQLPEAILRYQGLSLDQIDLRQMMLDYLDFSNEPETVFLDYFNIPAPKIKNIVRHFLKPDEKEKIFLICDQSLFGSGKEGFALSERNLFWKAHLEKARKVSFQALESIQRKEDWLEINGYFFNVSPSVNLKTMKLLKKLQRLFAG